MDVRGMMNYVEADVDSQAETDELLCDLQRTSSSNMLSSSGYTMMSSSNTGGMTGGNSNNYPT
jgi:hypothetical protein